MGMEMAWDVPMKWVGGVLALFLGWQVVVFTQLRAREYTDREKIAIERVCEEARAQTEALVKSRAEPCNILGAAHLVDDPSNYFTTMLKTNLAVGTSYELRDGSVVQQFFDQIRETVEGATSLEEIVFAANNVELDLLACGKVIEVREEDKVGHATLNYLIYDMKAGTWILNQMISADSRLDPGGWLKKRWKLFVALALIALIPWLCFKVLERVVERNTNAASGMLIAGLMVVNVLLLWWGGLFGAKIVVSSIIVLVALMYDLWACDFMAKKMDA